MNSYDLDGDINSLFPQTNNGGTEAKATEHHMSIELPVAEDDKFLNNDAKVVELA